MTKLKITLVRSTIGYAENQRRVVKGLGLRKLQSTVIHSDNPTIRGMINKVSHLLKVETINE
jgi:large subunit ribosomal protein L30